jgi:drug/metabolite transporter (DMT)-like permease
VSDRGSGAGPDLRGAGLILVAAAGLGAAVVGGSILALSAVGRRRLVPLRRLPRRDRWFIVAAAVANTVLNLAAFIAFERITIALTLLVFYLYPAGVALVSVAWLGERLDRLRWAALAISLAGTALVVAGAGDLGAVDALGIGLAFLAGMMQVFYVLAARHGFAHVPGPQAATMTMAGALGLYLVIAVVFGTLASLAQPLASQAAFWPVLAAGVIGAGVPTVCYIAGIRRLGPPRAAILATFEPVVGVALAAWLLDEQPAPVQLLGGALILVAAILLQLRPTTTAAEHEAVAGEAA